MADLLSDATAHRAVVVGSGIAGLSVALELGDCVVVTAGTLGDGASRLAQGGIAAALGGDDTPASHAADTRAVAGGLADPDVAALVADGGPGRIAWLLARGAPFDRDPDGRLQLGREAGHRADRIVHAGGDRTGAQVMATLVAAVRARPDIEVREGTRALDLVRAEHRVAGVLVRDPGGEDRVLLADAVVLATGGIGRIYARTTNPPGADGDGLAMAARVGATIRDPEFVQFHPTALATAHDPLPLITEALRGAGATLHDAQGHRYLTQVHDDAELAPRDVVARANHRALARGPIHLDARVIGPDLPARFPTVFAHAQAVGIDPRETPLPVTPAQHYHMGGVACDDAGRTSLPGLYVCGEVAGTGLHGANRLASNSLLEGLVFAERVAAAIATAPSPPRDPGDVALVVPEGASASRTDVAAAAIAELRETMWQAGGLIRDEAGLRAALATLARLRPELEGDVVGRNHAAVADLVLSAALTRRESRGSHHRADRPEPVPHGATSTWLHPEPAATRRLSDAVRAVAEVGA